MEILLATNNPGKRNEISSLLVGSGVTLRLPSEVGISDFDVEETGETFAENAELKARAFAEKSHLPTLADDSGLCVKALDGAPGVHSKRFVPGTDHDRNQYILKLMAEITDRSAFFITVLCFLDPATGEVNHFDGTVDGDIAMVEDEKATAGFGYDSVFIPKGYQETFARLGDDIKNGLSHRARAVEKFKLFLKDRAHD